MYNAQWFFRGKFAEAINLGEKEKLEIPGGLGGGGVSKTLRNGNPMGVRGSKVKNHPCGGMDIFCFLEPYNELSNLT